MFDVFVVAVRYTVDVLSVRTIADRYYEASSNSDTSLGN